MILVSLECQTLQFWKCHQIQDLSLCHWMKGRMYSQKFKKGTVKNDDPFGYSDQIQSYLHAGQNDPVVTVKNEAAFLAMEKVSGELALDIHKKEDFPWEQYYDKKKRMVAMDSPPPRDFRPVEDGKSGNMKLPTICAYCDWKKICHPGLRTFIYSNGPRFLTRVVRLPDVPEA